LSKRQFEPRSTFQARPVRPTSLTPTIQGAYPQVEAICARLKEGTYHTPPVRRVDIPSGHARWFERLLAELNFEWWVGDAAEIRTKRVRKQKTDREDARLLLRLLLEDRFPQIWVPSWRIEICGNCCGTGTGWCRRARAS
jgi:hypothetical protein